MDYNQPITQYDQNTADFVKILSDRRDTCLKKAYDCIKKNPMLSFGFLGLASGYNATILAFTIYQCHTNEFTIELQAVY